ncbi:DNA translocase FtsK [Paenibacillus sp. HB172176]|uniref:DNA translocase FtsK n=1 Tax=Paenibacillus sp. HB172176 TaxID=2493690 RepID=UPI00143BCA23|nr:DNA translocase FtsK [Paenibacillus sp. HB172176]
MAKKRKRKKSIGAQLKYEVYGILLITISIIAMSGEAAVGRALSKLFGLVLGKFYFVLALVGIYVGLHVMVKRAWPKGWTSRRTGLLILVLALTLSSSISEINARTEGLDRSNLTGGMILRALSDDLQTQLITVAPEDDVRIGSKTISGGYAGAIQYSVLFMLFGYYGAYILNFVMYAISILLITGKSYVELLGLFKKRLLHMLKLLNAKRNKRRSRRLAIAAAQNEAPEPDDGDVIDDDIDYMPEPPKKRKSLFFSWKHDRHEEPEEVPHDEWALANDGDDLSSGPTPAWKSDLNDSTQDWEPSGLPERNEAARKDRDELDRAWDAEAMDGLTEAGIHNEFPIADVAGENAEQSVMAQYGEQRDEIPELIDNHLGNVQYGEESEDERREDSEQGTSNRLLDSDALVQGDSFDSEESAPRRPMESEEESGEKEKPYYLPPFTLLQKPNGLAKAADASDMFDSRRKLEATLESFGVRAKVLDVVRGPAVTRYEVQPASGVKVSRIVGLTDDIALALAAKDIRMEAPIPGKSAIGIEVPNMEVSMVTMREVMETPAFQNSSSKLSIAFGRDIAGQTIVGNLARMPHLLVAGATGSGKSVCINGIITSILYKAKPDEVKFLMIDPKMVELNVYNGIPHLLAPVVTNPKRASLALKKIVVEMEKRYELFSKSATRNIEGYNALMAENPAAVLPYIVVIVDELADLMMVAANDVEDSIARLAQMARAAGIHLIIATQRPSVDVITGVIKANIPSRIAFGVSSQVDSRTILDMAGAEKLLGRGDMLFLPVGMSKPIRVQGAFLSDQEVEALVSYSRDQAEAEYKEDLVPEVDEESQNEDMQLDELFDQAVQIVVEAKQASVSLLQRRMRIGYTRAARLIDQMEARSVVGPYEGSKPREVLMTMEQFQATKISS